MCILNQHVHNIYILIFKKDFTVFVLITIFVLQYLNKKVQIFDSNANTSTVIKFFTSYPVKGNTNK